MVGPSSVFSLTTTVLLETTVTCYHDSLYQGLGQSRKEPRILGCSLSLAFHPKWPCTSDPISQIPHLLKPSAIHCQKWQNPSFFKVSEFFSPLFCSKGTLLPLLLKLWLFFSHFPQWNNWCPSLFFNIPHCCFQTVLLPPCLATAQL